MIRSANSMLVSRRTCKIHHTGFTVALVSIGLFWLIVVTAMTAQAVPLPPGGVVPLFGTTAAARPELAGVVLEDVIRPFSVDLTAFGGGIISGFIQDRVVRETASGTLDFYYRIHNDASSTGQVIRASRTDFSGLLTDVDFRTDGLGTVAPFDARRTASGDTIRFEFVNAPGTPGTLGPDLDSRFFFVHTGATAFDEKGTLEIDATSTISAVPVGGSTFPFLPTFEPIRVPEPASLLLLGSGLAGLVGLAWRRQRK